MPYRQLRQCVSNTVIQVGSLLDNVAGLAEELSTPRVTFHGSSRSNIASIVRYGFVVPGDEIGNTGKTLSFFAGATYGVGIYSSPDPLFASGYSGGLGVQRRAIKRPSDLPGQRLFVCATLMGRPLEVTRAATRRTTEIADKNANSHVSPDGLQYIVFDEAQILPCYVCTYKIHSEH